MYNPLLKKKISTEQCAGVVLLFLIALKSSVQASVMTTIELSVTVNRPNSSSIPQSWIDDFFGNVDPNYEVTPTSDYDGDGQFDYFEYFAGTDPTNGASSLKIIESTLQGNDAVIVWISTKSIDPEPRTYRAFRSGSEGLSALAAPDATIEQLSLDPDITSLELNGQLEINSSGETTTYIDLNVRNDFPLFYRVLLSKPEPKTP